MEEKITTVLSGINDKARRLLKTLTEFPQGVEGEEFGRASGITPAGFGGVLGGITKEAKKVNLRLTQLVQSESRLDGTRRYRWLAPTKLLLEHRGKVQ